MYMTTKKSVYQEACKVTIKFGAKQLVHNVPKTSVLSYFTAATKKNHNLEYR